MLHKGDVYKNFYVIDVLNIPDYKSTGIYLRHKNTGLEIFQLLNDDKENLFSFCFRTPVENGKGLPHIIEHSVLCGSEKYHLKEPFTTLNSRTITSFLNAMTYPDKTCYPGASVVESEYFKIMDCYADSVFFPTLSEDTFKQEGHRFEMDKDGNLSIQGVVYNEMKGNYSDLYSVAWENISKAIMPSSNFEFDSGGDPLEITKLTYEEFLAFHKKYYSPENCILFLYGNIPTETQLDFFNDKFIKRLEQKFNLSSEKENYTDNLPSVIPSIKKLFEFQKNTEPKEYKFIGPKTETGGNIISLVFRTDECYSQEKDFLFEFLGGGDASPLRKKLIESKLGQDNLFAFYSINKNSFFIIGLVGVKDEDVSTAKEFILKSIEEIYNGKITKDDLSYPIMHKDFSLREEDRNHGPRSIEIMSSMADAWVYGEHPAKYLSPIQEFEQTKQKIYSDENYIRSLIEKYFIKNNTHVYVVTKSDESFLKNRNEAEKKIISEAEKTINKELLKKDLDELHKFQNQKDSPEDIASIPRLEVNDLKVNLQNYHSKIVHSKNNVCIFQNKENTNGIIYFELLFPCDCVSPEDFSHLTFLSRSITSLGWGKKSWAECEAEIGKVSGGFYSNIVFGDIPPTQESFDYKNKFMDENFVGREWLRITIKLLSESLSESLELFAQFINQVSFTDKERMKNLIKEYKNEKSVTLVSNGSDYCTKRVQYRTSRATAIQELLWGFTSVKTAISYDEEKPEELLKKFESLWNQIKSYGGIIHICADEESLKKSEPIVEKFINDINLCPAKKLEHEFKKEDYLKCVVGNSEEKLDIVETDTQVGYAAMSIESAPYLTEEASAEEILASYQTAHTFWEKLRTEHGCYGAWMNVENFEKLALFVTYRDPNPYESFNIFPKCISTEKMTDEDIQSAIVSTYGDYIAPRTAQQRSEKGFRRTIYGISHNQIVKNLENILKVKKESVVNASKRFEDEIKSEKTQRVMLCNKNSKFSGNILDLGI